MTRMNAQVAFVARWSVRLGRLQQMGGDPVPVLPPTSHGRCSFAFVTYEYLSWERSDSISSRRNVAVCLCSRVYCMRYARICKVA